MTFTIKVRGASSQPILAVYCCEEHGPFDAEVQREPNGDTPDEIPCDLCSAPSHWTPSPVFGRVKAWEVVRGKWEKPERKTFTDTRDLGEGMPWHEWKEKRRKIWEEKRLADVREMSR